MANLDPDKLIEKAETTGKQWSYDGIGIIAIPPGEHTLIAPLIIKDKPYIVQGAGMQNTILNYNGDGYAIQFERSNGIYDSMGAGIRDLHLQQTIAQPDGYGIQVDLGLMFEARNVWVSGFTGAGGAGMILDQSFDVRLDNVHLQGNRTGIVSTGCTQFTCTHLMLNQNSEANGLFYNMLQMKWSGGLNQGAPTDCGVKFSACDSISIDGVYVELTNASTWAWDFGPTANNNIELANCRMSIVNAPRWFTNLDNVRGAIIRNNRVTPASGDIGLRTNIANGVWVWCDGIAQSTPITNNHIVHVSGATPTWLGGLAGAGAPQGHQIGVSQEYPPQGISGSQMEVEKSTYNLMLDPRDFGAVGDGVTDDTTAILAWAAALSEATIYNPLIGVARGSFRFSSEIEISPTGTSGTIYLDLRGSSFIWNGGDGVASTDSFTFSNSANTITRSSGSFITDGFTSNRWIEVSDSVNNNKRLWVTNVAALTITVDNDLFANSSLTDEIATCTIRDRFSCFRFGNGKSANKWFYSSMQGLNLSQVGNVSNVTGVELDHSDFMSLNDITIAIGGGVASGSRCLDISGFSKQGYGSVNSCTVTSIKTAGAEEGIMVDTSNVFTMRGGKIQQHVSGFNARYAAVIQLHTLDFSLNTQNAVFFDGVGAIDIHNIYAESNGPGTRDNDAKLFYIKDCRGVSFTGCNFNGTNGTITEGTHPGYGIYIEGSDGISITGSTGKLCQRALLYCDANCRDVVLDSSCVFEVGVGWSEDAFQPITDESGLLVNRAKGRALTPLSDGLTNLIEITDVSNDGYWARENGTTFNGKITNENRNKTVPIMGFPNISASTSKLIYTTTITNVQSHTLYFRAKIKLIDFQEPVVANRTTDLAAIRLLIYKGIGGASGSVVSGIMRVGKVWDWYEVKWDNIPSDDIFQPIIEVRQAQEPINIAIDDVQLYLVPNSYTVEEPDTISNLFAWYDASIGVEEATANPAENGDPVEFWLDQSGDGYNLAQGTLGDRPTFTSTSSYTGLPEITFNGTTGELISEDSASTWSFLHDGTGCTMIIVMRPNSGNFVLDTANASASSPGITIDWLSPDDIRLRISNGSGTVISNLTTTTNVVPSTGAIVTIRHGNDLSPNVELRANAQTVLTGSYSDTPSLADPAGTLRVGNRVSSDLPWGGGILELIFYNRVLNDTELQTLETYIRDKYGYLI